MSHINKKVPKRRFEEFNNADDWEQRKFEDCFNFPVSTNSLSRVMLNYDKGEVKNVHYGDVLIKYPCILNIKKEEIPYITGGCLEAYKSNLLENGDLIFADAAEDETVGKAVEVNGITNENLVSGLHTIVARAITQKAKYFLGYYINSDIYHRQLLRLMQGSKVSAISKGNLQKTDVSFPKDIEEQQKIGSYFKKLDDTIVLYQRKLEKIKALKTAYLSEMFPAEGETKPKRRFAGFTDDWEQRKLEDILDVRSGRDYKHLDSGDIPVYGTGGYMLSVGEALSYEEDAIGIGRKGTIDKPYILKAPFWTVDTLFYTVPKRDSDLNFIHSIFQKINWKSKDESTGVPSLSKTTINGVSVFTPSCSEQKEIGTFFNKLDDTIALHQRKLQKLQNIKKAYLNEMFI
ncbi:restriction endonuclease subunit S [Listeria monocytogenes]|nr:restriction endonuclease subunit S [Listeria monocytogenes]EAE8623678.1 restriction endonuclease subunit S [Listeria monocytogenes]EAE8629761.1 restriction endonuclease subunit S [Listeria monocytogenes]EAE8632279.1 restriction endonuclease subunit S [Listeria monocytogenes]EAE8635545.1 restriction endonuclease subunit S [Listeria monocytogenes]